MTVTTPTHVDSSIPEIWANLTLRDMLRKGFWERFRGPEGSRSPIIERTDLVNNEGDTIHIQITDPLVGAGVAGDVTALEGSEENLTTSSMKVIPLFYRHGVRWYTRANKKSILDLRAEARLRLSEWGGEKMDDVRFANFVQRTSLNGENYTPNELYIGSDGSPTIAEVATGDILTVEGIQYAKLTMYNNRALPLWSADGNDYFVLVAHPNALYGLKRSAEYRDWVREAEVRGKENPFFRGATAMIDGVVIFQHNNVYTANDGAASVAVARNLLFGAEAFVEGLDQSPSWEEDSFDYKNQFGIAYGFAFQPRRGLAKNSLVVYTAADTPTAP
jgi:N4-gp56 family major capsid protein